MRQIVSLRMPDALLERVETVARSRGVSPSSLMRALIAAGLLTYLAAGALLGVALGLGIHARRTDAVLIGAGTGIGLLIAFALSRVLAATADFLQPAAGVTYLMIVAALAVTDAGRADGSRNQAVPRGSGLDSDWSIMARASR